MGLVDDSGVQQLLLLNNFPDRIIHTALAFVKILNKDIRQKPRNKKLYAD